VLAVCGGGDAVCAAVRDLVCQMAEPRSETAGFGAKASAAALCAAAHGYLERAGGAPEAKREVRLAYAKIAADDAPLVRASAVGELAAVCAAVREAPGFVGDLSETVTRLLEDEHDVVRLAAVVELGKILGNEGSRATAVAWSESVRAQLEESAAEEAALGVEEPWYLAEPSARVVHAAHRDASWRVREAVARAFGGYCAYLAAAPLARDGGRDELAAGLLGMFAALFDDPEVEVRAAAFGSTVAVAAVWPAAVAKHAELLDAACRGADAPELKVRLAAASTLTKLLGVVAPAACPGAEARALADAQARVFEVVEARLFSDEHVDVVLATLRELEGVVPALEPAPCGRVAALAESSTHENWRVRSALLGALPALAVARGRDAFETQLLEGFVRAFQDRISQVRTTAVAVLGRLRDLEADGAPFFESSWLMDKVGKRLSELYLTMSYYLYRITIVQAFERLAHSSLDGAPMEAVVLFLCDCARDDVPNVRFTAVRALETVSKHAEDRLVASFIKPILNELLANDGDGDVKFYVKEAVSAL